MSNGLNSASKFAVHCRHPLAQAEQTTHRRGNTPVSDEELDENEADDGLPTPQAFCLSVPLYKKFEFNKDASNPFFGIEHYKGTLDCYCEGCGRHSVFHRMDKADYREHHHQTNYLFNLSFGCSRDFSHRLFFIFRSHQGVLEKIGQYPSMADLDTPDLQKISSVNW
jgi:hypothetical protein